MPEHCKSALLWTRVDDMMQLEASRCEREHGYGACLMCSCDAKKGRSICAAELHKCVTGLVTKLQYQCSKRGIEHYVPWARGKNALIHTLS